MSMTRAIAQLVEQLVYTCANAFQESTLCNQYCLIEKSMSYSIDSKEQENNSLTNIYLVQSDSDPNSDAKWNPSLI